jgi:tetratricopeptide (TPR) repeat protein
MAESVKVFLSTVSDEFRAYRDQLRADLTRHNVEAKAQEDFKDLGGGILDELDVYIAHCDCVVHLVGDMTGSAPLERDVDALLAKHSDLVAALPPLGEALRDGVDVSYTQWEAWLALYHHKLLLIAKAAGRAERDPRYAPTDASRAAQAAHLARLQVVKRYPGCEFNGQDDLAKYVLSSAILDLLVKAGLAQPPRRPKNLPFASLGSLFKGREQDLDTLHKALTAEAGGRTAIVGRALHGLGGIGKTRLAVEYALKHESEHSALLFLRADAPASLETSLAALAGPEVLDLPEKDVREDAAKIAAALGWLAAHPGWLMIVDNVDDPAAVTAVDKLLARLSGGKVVVTGRAGNFPASLRKLELGVLDRPASVAFLLERTDTDRAHALDDAKLAQELAGELGGLALGLEQAGAYIATERIGFARYLKLWRSKRVTVLDWFDKTLMSYDHDTGLAATWATSVDRLTADARRLLERLAFLAPEPIPDTLLDVAAPGDPETFDARDALANLYAYSLVSRAAVEAGKTKQDGFVVHRLVQDFARRSMTEEQRRGPLLEALGWVNEAFAGDPQDVRTWPVLDPLAPHAVAVARQANEAEIAEPTARIFNQLGLLLNTKARYAEAEPLYRRALTIDEARRGPDHPLVAAVRNNLAGLLQDTNRLGEAEPLYRRVLATFEASYGPDHPNLATGLNNLAGLLRATNRLDEAELLYRRALAIVDASYDSGHPAIARALSSLARLLKDTNRLGEAEPLYRRALAIDEVSYGPHHPAVASDLSNLAVLLYVTNRFGEAEPLFRRALTIDETSYGLDHPEVANRLNNLAGLLQDTNRFGEAEPLYRQALAILEASHGPDHPAVATGLNNLGDLLWATNRLGEAEALFRRAQAIDESSFGRDHPNVARDLNNLASLLQDTNRLVEAEPLYRRALAIDEVSYGPDHPNVANRLSNLAGLLKVTNRLFEAEPLFRRALAIDEASYGPDHPHVATGLNNLAELLRETNRLGDAEPLYRHALAIDQASYGVIHPDVARDLNNLALLLGTMNRLDEAEPLFRRALSIFEASYGPDHPRVAAGLNNLAGLLSSTSRLGEAKPLYRRALTIFEASYGPDHPHTATVRAHLAALEAKRG